MPCDKGILYFVGWPGLDWTCKTRTSKTRTASRRSSSIIFSLVVLFALQADLANVLSLVFWTLLISSPSHLSLVVSGLCQPY